MANKYWLSTSSGDWSNTANWSGSSLPIHNDNVFIPPGTASITTNLTALNAAAITSLTNFIVMPGYTGTIGAASGSNLQITVTGLFDFSGAGTAYFDLQASAISPLFRTTTSPSTGYRGAYLIGSALATLNVAGGNVGLAAQPGDTATATTVCSDGTSSNVFVGSGTTLTNFKQYNGFGEAHCAGTTASIYGGTFYTKESGAWTTIATYGGTVYPESTGTVTNIKSYGGTTSALTSGAARTWSNLLLDGGSVSYDPAVITVSAFTNPDWAVRISVTKP